MEEEMRDDDGAAFIHFQIFEQRTTVVTGDSKQPLRFASGFICLLRAIRHVLRVVFSRDRAEEGQFFRPESPISDRLRSRSPSGSLMVRRRPIRRTPPPA